MKIFYKTEVDILESNVESHDYYRSYNSFDSDTILISEKHIEALRSGKMLAWSDGQVCQFVLMKKVDE